MKEQEMKGVILVIDDDNSVRKSLADIFQFHGHRCREAATGTQGLELFREEPFDAVLIDIELPDFSGVELLREIKKKKPDQVCWIITGNATREHAIDALQAGANDFFTKPLEIQPILRKIQEAVKSVLLRNQLKNTQQQMLQQEKMASVGQLAAGVAHEINNPMGFLTSNLSTLRKYFEKIQEYEEGLRALITSEDGREQVKALRKKMKVDLIFDDLPDLFDESLEGADRVKTIVRNLKNFSRMDQAEMKMADINECLQTTLNIVWNELKYTASVHRNYGEIPKILCYPQELNQVFMNLLVNAGQAIKSQGVIRIRTWTENDFVLISIADNGCGIPPEKITRIFDPFFTTKEVGKGTGLGLSISYDIVRKHNGEIDVESREGSGTTFTVKLPVVIDEKRVES